MPQLARFHETFASKTTGLPLASKSVTVYREGATFVSGSGTTPATLTVRNKGKIVAGDTVFINAVTGTTYTVDSVTDTTVVVSGFAGTLSPTALDRIIPSNDLPTLYEDDQGGASKTNPLTTTATGLAEAWLAAGAYDHIISGSGITTPLLSQGIVHVRELIDTTLNIQGVRTKGEPVFNIRHIDFGALADDSTDAGPALQAAHDAAQAIGGSVFIPSGPYVIETEVTWNRNVNLIGEHTPANLVTDTETGTRLRRNADIIMLNMTGTHRTTDRIGRSRFGSIHFRDGTNISNKSMIFGKYADNMVLEHCSFSQPAANTTGGHMIDAEECWDWKLYNCLWKHCGDNSNSKHCVNLFNGAADNTNFFEFVGCKFYNGLGKAVFSDVSGGGQENNQIFFNRCKFEDSFNAALVYVDGDMNHVYVKNCVFATGDGRHINITSESNDWVIDSCQFASIGDTPTEYIQVLGTKIIVRDNNFTNIGAATTGVIHVNFTTGDDGKGISITGNNFFEASAGTTPLVKTTGTLSRFSHIAHNDGDFSDDNLTAAAPALQPWGLSRLNSTDNAVDATLAAGGEIGSIKTIVMVQASNSSTVSVANHEGSDPEVITFAAVDDTAVLMWTGTEWITIKLSGASV